MRRVAAIDCGTNTIKLLVADLPDGGESGAMAERVREMRMVRLGQGVDATGRLADAALRRVFAAIDETAINAVGAAALADVKPGGEWKNSYDILFCDLQLKATYRMSLANPRFRVQPKSGNTYQVEIDVGGYADFHAKCAGASANPGAGANGSLRATAAVEIAPDGKIHMVFKSLDGISLHWSFNGLPAWMDAVLSEILSAFNPVVQLAITAALRDRRFELYTIPRIEATIAGSQFEIRLKDLKLDSTADGGGKPLVLVTGGAEVKMKK